MTIICTRRRVIRSLQPNVALQQFIHIPWPEPDPWRYLPTEIVSSICAGLLANDSVAFQTKANADNFCVPARIPARRRDRQRRRQIGSTAHARLGESGSPYTRPELLARLAQPAALEYRAKLASRLVSSRSCASTGSIRRKTSSLASRLRRVARTASRMAREAVRFLPSLCRSRTGAGVPGLRRRGLRRGGGDQPSLRRCVVASDHRASRAQPSAGAGRPGDVRRCW